uniref:ARAD1D29480p n=1 Tax=Blastobotrys adeninivorans TaxID=409370 RepID=A0A060TBR8_BLAAD
MFTSSPRSLYTTPKLDPPRTGTDRTHDAVYPRYKARPEIPIPIIATMSSSFIAEIANYRVHHLNSVNVALHRVCIPAVYFTMMVPMTLLSLPHNAYVNLATVVASLYSAYYLSLDVPYGLIGSGLMAALAYGGTKFQLTYGPRLALLASLAIWILSGVGQAYGHKYHEGGAPAAGENPKQAFLMPPLFVVVELGTSLGYRRSLMQTIDRHIQESRNKD